MSQQHDDLIGQTLGQFTIIEEIGRGGMATVYSARQQSMNRVVAIKVLPRSFMHDSRFIVRFEREVEVISRLEHPHILPIYDYGEADGMPFIAMRYLNGGSMADRLRQGRPPLEELARQFMQVAQALDYAHRQGVVHRDLKPGNIMLDDGGNAYLSDFGIAHVTDSDMTHTGAVIGTPLYMSPEQAMGQPINKQSDIYTLGIVLFEMITGRSPYHAETPMSMLMKHVNEPVPSVREYRPEVPAAADEVIARATAKEAQNRYTTAVEFIQDFSEVVRTAGVQPTSTSALHSSASHADAPTIPDPPANVTAGYVMPSSTPGSAAPAHPPYAATPTPAADAALSPAFEHTSFETHREHRSMDWVVVALLLVLVAGIAVAVTYAANPGGIFALAIEPATPFAGAVTRSEPGIYAISIPEAWEFNDESTDDVLHHVWRTPGDLAYIALVISQGDPQQYLDELPPHLTLIDTTTTDDGTIRHSYRLNAAADRLRPGQLDVFATSRDGSFAALQLYAADDIGGQSATIDLLQQIVVSLRLRFP